MVRIVGVNLPSEKRIDYGLTQIYGVGWELSKKILAQANIDSKTKVGDLKEEDAKKLADLIEKNFKVEGVLKEEVVRNIKRLKEIGVYRGLRHARSLPVRGQRTKSNARTKRGKRKTVGALKKEDAAKVQQPDTKK